MAERLLSETRVVGNAAEYFGSGKAYFAYLTDHMPRCPLRRDAAHVLAAIMLAFILQHEEGHIVLGHADYVTSNHLAEHISETTADVTDLLYQVMG